MAEPSFYLDRAAHQYHYGDRIIPGITQVLKYWGIIDATHFTERGRQIGTAVHLWTMLLDRGSLDWSRVASCPEVEGRLRAYDRFLNDYSPAWEYSETPFCYPGGLYACTIDRAGSMGDSKAVVVEIKGGAKQKFHELQTGMQVKAMESRPWRRFCLYLKADGTYALEEHRNPQDGMIGVGLVSAMNWRLQTNGNA